MTQDSAKKLPASGKEGKSGRCGTDDSDTGHEVLFLGHGLAVDEYKQACQNLAEFFELLRSWRQEQENGKKELPDTAKQA